MVIFQKRVADLAESALARFIARARQAAGLKATVDVLVTSNTEMKSLNRRFRKMDKATDVLAFPAEQGDGKSPSAGEGRNASAGEIAISAEIAHQNARALGHTTAEEVKILVLHGILHLRGYDHERDSGQMARREQQLRARLGLPDGLIERAFKDAGMRVAKSAINGNKRRISTQRAQRKPSR